MANNDMLSGLFSALKKKTHDAIEKAKKTTAKDPKDLFEQGAHLIKAKLTEEVRELKQAGNTLQSAFHDFKDVAKGKKEMSDFIDSYKPKIQGSIRKELGPRSRQLIFDDNVIIPALNASFGRMPPPLPWLVSKDKFVDFCMTHRETLLGKRELRIAAIRQEIEQPINSKEAQASFLLWLGHQLSKISNSEEVIHETRFAVKYMRSIPDIMEMTAKVAIQTKRYDFIFPILQELEFQFIDFESEQESTDIVELLKTCYLALTLIQSLSDRNIQNSKGPLIDVDLRPANGRIAHLLGSCSQELNDKAAEIIKESNFMKDLGSYVGAAIPVISIAAILLSVSSPEPAAEAAVDSGGGALSADALAERAISDAYTGALFGSECVQCF
jgi:hypothetical protein